MAHRKVYSTGGRYGTRMMTAGEPLTLSGPNARLMLALGKVSDKRSRKLRTEPVQSADERPALRAAYKIKFGKNPFGGWDAATLREKIAAA